MNQVSHSNALPKGYRIHWYEIHSILGRGAFGITYLAKDNNLNRLVAIKEYLPTEFSVRHTDSTVQPLTKDKDNLYNWGLSSFVEEARTLARFNHPNIIRVVSVFELNNTAYMVMDYERGDDLSIVTKKRHSFSQNNLLHIFLPLMDGLTLVHNIGFVHRDIKPANIFIRKDNSSVLLDFGSARQTIGNKSHNVTGLVTVGYAPFEQYDRSSDKQGPWSDIYALGATMYFCITGKKPVDAIKRSAQILNSGKDIYQPLSSLHSNRYSVDFLSAVDCALNFYVEDRPQSIVDWKRILLGQYNSDAFSESITTKESYDDSDKTITAVEGGGQKPSSVTPVHSKNISLSNREVQDYERAERSLTENIEIQYQESSTVQISNRAIKNSRPKMRWKLKSAIIFLIMLFGIGYLFDLDQKLVKVASQLKELEKLENKPETDVSVQIEIHLQKAETRLIENKLVQPKNDNALNYFRKVLKLDPGNSRALAGLNRISEIFISEAQKNLNMNNLIEAESNVNILQSISPGSSKAIDLRVELQLAKNKSNEIMQMHQRAEKLLKNGQYVLPIENNAFSVFQRILEIDTENQAATQGLSNIIQNYIKQINTAIGAGNIEIARAKFLEIKSAFPGSIDLQTHYLQIMQEFQSQFDRFIAMSKFDEAQSVVNTIRHFAPNDEIAIKLELALNLARSSVRPEFETTTQIIESFISAFKSQNTGQLDQLSEYSEGRNVFVKNFFSNYLSFKVEIGHVHYTPQQHDTVAKVKLSKLINMKGGIVKPGVWSEFDIRVKRNAKNKWKVFW